MPTYPRHFKTLDLPRELQVKEASGVVYSEEEINNFLRIAEQAKDVDNISPIESYVYSRGIKPGNIFYNDTVIYIDYKKWAGKNALPKRKFTTLFKKLGFKFDDWLYCGYYLSPFEFQVTQDDYFKERRAFRDARAARERKRKKKIPT